MPRMIMLRSISQLPSDGPFSDLISGRRGGNMLRLTRAMLFVSCASTGRSLAILGTQSPVCRRQSPCSLGRCPTSHGLLDFQKQRNQDLLPKKTKNSKKNYFKFLDKDKGPAVVNWNSCVVNLRSRNTCQVTKTKKTHCRGTTALEDCLYKMSTTRAQITIAVRDDLAESHAGHVVPMFIAKLAYMLKKETRCVLMNSFFWNL